MTRTIAAALGALVVASMGPAARTARAQGNTAQAQFDYGLAEMEAGRYASGCPALAESYRIDPHPGVLFTLAECENRWGRIASALTHYEAYLDLFDHMSAEQKAHQRGRDRVCKEQLGRLRLKVPQLAVSLPANAPPGTTVTRDGEPLGAPSLGVALPVDPGDHVVVARTPDGVAHETRVTLAPAERKALVADLSAASVPAPAAGATAPSPPAAQQPDRAPPAAMSPLRTWAWIAAGVGVAGLVLGGVAGAVVLGDKSAIDAGCRPDRTCNAAGLSAASQAQTFGLLSDVGFGAGAAAAVTSVVLFALAPSRRWQPVAAAQPHGGFVGVRAAW
jgi:hypothetical protein